MLTQRKSVSFLNFQPQKYPTTLVEGRMRQASPRIPALFKAHEDTLPHKALEGDSEKVRKFALLSQQGLCALLPRASTG